MSLQETKNVVYILTITFYLLIIKKTMNIAENLVNAAVAHHMADLLKDICQHIEEENSSAVVLVTDYMILKDLYRSYDEVQKLIPLMEEKIKKAEDWGLLKESYIPTLDEHSRNLLSNLL